MSFDVVTAAMDLGGKLIDRLMPDPAAKQQAALQLLQMQQSGELAQLTADTDIAKAQIQVDQAEAQSGSLFVAGGRPMIIWVCAAALGNDFILRPIALFVMSAFHVAAVWPELDMTQLMPLLLGLLGLSAMRSYEKIQGVTS